MSVSNPSVINLAIPDNQIDQIIGVFSNTLSLPAPTSAQGYTFASDTKAHNFGDSCYFQGIFTQDGGTTWNDFGAQTPASGGFFQSVDVEAYTDSSNIYVQMVNYYDVNNNTSQAYTVTYKVFLLAKNTMANPITPLSTNNIILYNSNNNFQKIFMSGTTSISVAAGSTGYSSTITHNLGYIPSIKAFFINGNNQVFALNQWAQPIPDSVPAIEAHITSSTLVFYSDQSGFGAPGVSGNIDYRIYLDQ